MGRMTWGGDEDPDDYYDPDEDDCGPITLTWDEFEEDEGGVKTVYEYYEGENSYLYESLRHGTIDDLDGLSKMYTGAWVQSGGLAILIMDHAAVQGWLDWTLKD